MKVVICGAGQVGMSIAAYLAEEGNDVTVIDKDPELVAEINETLNVSAIIGHAPHPDIFEKAGVGDAEMLIAATQSDEVNMVSCQVAHTLFNVPTKVARLRDQHYLKPAWAGLFSRDHLPIDVVISPEIEVAKAIANRVRVPGAFNVIPLADNLVQLVSVICKPDCPLINTPLKHLTPLFPEMSIVILATVRGETKIIPSADDMLLAGDEVYFVCATDHLQRAMLAFGYDSEQTRQIVIVGAGKIGMRLAEEIREKSPDVSVRVIESNAKRADYVAEALSDITLVQGDGLDKAILDEVGISTAETIVTVTNHDESNILTAMLAKQQGCERAIVLINNKSFSSLVANLGIDAVVNPRTITISTILQHIRRGRIKAAHSLRDGFAEILEVEALDTSSIVNTPIREIKRPKEMIFGLIVRGNTILIPKPDAVIRPDDRVIILAAHDQVKKVEQMFAVRPEYF